jgi:hypothetical protein
MAMNRHRKIKPIVYPNQGPILSIGMFIVVAFHISPDEIAASAASSSSHQDLDVPIILALCRPQHPVGHLADWILSVLTAIDSLRAGNSHG